MKEDPAWQYSNTFWIPVYPCLDSHYVLRISHDSTWFFFKFKSELKMWNVPQTIKFLGIHVSPINWFPAIVASGVVFPDMQRAVLVMADKPNNLIAVWCDRKKHLYLKVFYGAVDFFMLALIFNKAFIIFPLSCDLNSLSQNRTIYFSNMWPCTAQLVPSQKLKSYQLWNIAYYGLSSEKSVLKSYQ